MSCLAQVFENAGALGNLETFTSLNGPNFYGLAPNASRMTLQRSEDPVVFPEKISTDAGEVAVFDPAMPLHWRVVPET
jgi:dihydroorotase